jgi:hypothetical protein
MSGAGIAAFAAASATQTRGSPMFRKLLIASTAVFALSTGAALAGNTATVTQTGVVNTSTVTQDGFTINRSTVTQLGVINNSTNQQGTNSPGFLNKHTLTQVGVQNTAVSDQVGFVNKINAHQVSVFGSNSINAGQLGVLNGGSITQDHIP